jgi:hypothetical protein
VVQIGHKEDRHGEAPCGDLGAIIRNLVLISRIRKEN